MHPLETESLMINSVVIYCWSTFSYKYQGNISSRFSNNSAAPASELLNIEEKFSWYYTDGDVINSFKSSTLHRDVTCLETIKCLLLWQFQVLGLMKHKEARIREWSGESMKDHIRQIQHTEKLLLQVRYDNTYLDIGNGFDKVHTFVYTSVPCLLHGRRPGHS